MAKILIVGSGAWGTALSNILLENKHQVFIYGICKEEINDLKKGINSKYFGIKKLYGGAPTKVGSNLEEMLSLKPEFILLAVPTPAIMPSILSIIPLLKVKPVFINVSKGLNSKASNLWSVDIKKIIENHSTGFVTLFGPSFASEVFDGESTVMNSIGINKPVVKAVAELFNNNHFRCIENTDEIGAELCGALKNVMAIACGLTFQLHLSINTRSAILAQAINEISSIVIAKKGNVHTILDFCGVGDIFLTCTDEQSRNFSFGKSIASFGAKHALALSKVTMEGLNTLPIAYEIVQKHKINAPIIKTLYDVVFKDADPKTFVRTVIKNITR